MAVLWFKDSSYQSADNANYIDLHDLMGNLFRNSEALGVSVDETGISVVGSAQRRTTGAREAILWKRTAIKVAGNLILQDTIGTGTAGNEQIGYVMTNGTITYTGNVHVNQLGGGAYSFNIPFNAPSGAYTLRFKGGTFLAKTRNVVVTGLDIYIDTSLPNGDVDQDGEVGPGDFEAVVAHFGDSGSADCDNDGEVGPSDFEIIVANFGLEDQ